jgi:chaperonin GroEL
LINVVFYMPELFFLYKVGAEIVRKSLSYPLKLIAKNAGVNGSVVTEKVCAQIVLVISLWLCNSCLTSLELVDIQVLANENFRYGYNAATGEYEDLMAAGIIDPTKVCFCRRNAVCCY